MSEERSRVGGLDDPIWDEVDRPGVPVTPTRRPSVPWAPARTSPVDRVVRAGLGAALALSVLLNGLSLYGANPDPMAVGWDFERNLNSTTPVWEARSWALVGLGALAVVVVLVVPVRLVRPAALLIGSAGLLVVIGSLGWANHSFHNLLPSWGSWLALASATALASNPLWLRHDRRRRQGS